MARSPKQKPPAPNKYMLANKYVLAECIFAQSAFGPVEAALCLKDGRPVRFLRSPPDPAAGFGALHLGRICKKQRGSALAFVELADGVENGMLHRQSQTNGHSPLQEGMVVPVQIAREAIDDKGPRLTTAIRLTGRYLDLLPTLPLPLIKSPRPATMHFSSAIRPAVQQKIQGWLKMEKPQSGTLFFKPAVMGLDEDILIDVLAREYAQLADRAAPVSAHETPDKIPMLLSPAADSLQQALLLLGPRGKMMTDDRLLFAKARDLAEANYPDLLPGISFSTSNKNQSTSRLWEESGMASFHEAACAAHVDFTDHGSLSGGGLWIEATRALTAIDLDAGNMSASLSSDAEIIRFNLLAADEIAFQIFTRELAGLIVIDFLKPRKQGSMRAVQARLRTTLHMLEKNIGTVPALSQKSVVHPVTPSGLIEVQRPRTRPPLLI